MDAFPTISRALYDVHDYISEHYNERKDRPNWAQIFEKYLRPAIRSGSKEVIVSIIGPTNAGKSSLFNFIPSYYRHSKLSSPEISKVTFHMGTTARPVIMANPNSVDGPRLTARLGPLKAWENAEESAQSGLPVIYPIPDFYKKLVFVDNPAFDSEKRIEEAKKTFLWSDVVLYVFSSPNDWNIGFMRSLFNEIGVRPVILVFRGSHHSSQSEATYNTQEVSRAIFPNTLLSTETGLPVPVVGSYVIHESERKDGRPISVWPEPLLSSPEFSFLLNNMDSNFERVRQRSLRSAFVFALQGYTEELRENKKKEEHRQLIQDLLEVVLAQSVTEAGTKIPSFGLTKELEKFWLGHSSGIRKLGRAIGFLKTFRTKPPDFNLSAKSLQEIQLFLQGYVDKAISQFLLTISRGRIEINTKTPGANTLIKLIDDYRSEFGIATAAPPYVQHISKDEVVIAIAEPNQIQKIMESNLNRDWSAITAAAKKDIIDDFNSLSAVIQGEFLTVARDRFKSAGISGKAARLILPYLAVTPAVVALSLIWSQGRTLIDVGSWLMIGGAMVGAHYISKWDDMVLRKEWEQIIDIWFQENQQPRLFKILRKHILDRTSNQAHQTGQDSTFRSIELADQAIEELTQQPTLLLKEKLEEK